MNNDKRRVFHDYMAKEKGYCDYEAFMDLKEYLPVSLCKFYSNRRYAISAVKRNIINLSRPESFNDPFDCALNLNYPALLNDIEQRNNTIYEYGAKMEYINKMKKLDGKERKNSFVGCLGEGKLIASNLMWAIYSNNHKGFCVEYDYLSAFSILKNNGYIILPVYYTDKYIAPMIWAMEDKFRYILSAYYTKSTCWEQELEWRIYKYKETKDDRVEAYIGDPKSIYVGCRANDYLVSRLRTICIEKQVKLYKMELSSNSYTLSPKLIVDGYSDVEY